jgi:hypothetical protein
VRGRYKSPPSSYLREATEQEAAEAERGFDLAEHRLDDLLA